MAGPEQETVSSVAATTPATIAPVVLPKTSNSESLLKIRHSMSHVMAMAVQKLFPTAQVTIGPWTETGFYYDFDNLASRGILGQQVFIDMHMVVDVDDLIAAHQITERVEERLEARFGPVRCTIPKDAP